ncbi:hypothetical protein AGMMS50268_08300 [Spirochaetia bacterium]|nr:hypothetical protein AGMMS50268_08300 [Spirochaetia bacterium]
MGTLRKTAEIFRMIKKPVLLVIAAFAVAGAVSAQVTISGGFVLSSAEDDYSIGYSGKDVGFGGNVSFDYLLPIGIPLSLGAEVGVHSAIFEKVVTKALVIPLLLRVGYHLDLIDNLDLYAVGKIGYVIPALTYSYTKSFSGNSGNNINVNEDEKGGLGIGIDIGAAYYFTPRIGVFAEVGFDVYNVSLEMSGSDNYTSYNETIDIKFTQFLTAGISIKLGKPN